ncbi:MAG: macro domain-containing protein, partial [Gemmatimonadota bacterium]|nr:macro domain-containing protein [Gemmatimonadota bacterium]
SLERAREEGLRTLAFPAISTGVYGYPKDQATPLALRTVADYVRQHPDAFEEIRFVLFSEGDLEIYRGALDKLAS